MRPLLLIVFLLVFWNCGGSLSEEQRKKLKEGKQMQEIKKVTEAEILDKAFSVGREVVSHVENESDFDKIDSIGEANKVKVLWLDPKDPAAPEIERLLLEAYLSGSSEGDSLRDNVQQVGQDSLLYTKPVTKELPGGVLQFEGTWGVRMSKKNLILAMD